MIYLDNGATSFHKPPAVYHAVQKAMFTCANPGRGGHEPAMAAANVVYNCRERAGKLFHCEPEQVVFTQNSTEALNIAIRGILKPGDHVLTSSVEHNAVMRPLLQLTGVEYDRIPCNREGLMDPADIEPLIRPNTRLLVMAHGSNVCGSVQNAKAVGEICWTHGIAFVLDAAQTAGHYPVDFEAFQLSALCVPGHKGLLGPSGIGALLMRDKFAKALDPIIL